MSTAPVDVSAQPAPVIGSPKPEAKPEHPRLPAVGAIWLVVMLTLAFASDRYLTSFWESAGCLVAARLLPCILGVGGLFVFLGLAKFGRPAGALINQQNVISLSRLQMVLWTVLVLGFMAAVVLARLAGGATGDPLSVAVAPELWGLLGISSASLVGTPFLLSVRRDKEPIDKVAASAPAAARFDESASAIASRAAGPLYVNPSPSDARFSDIFEGDELANTQMVDVAKVQMFAFTVIAALVWTVAAAKLLASSGLFADAVSLPVLQPGLVTLLGVSNAGYLLNKVVDHTPTK